MNTKKRLIPLIVSAVIFTVLLVAYFVFVAPLLNESTDTEPPQLFEGEFLGSNNRILMFKHTERASIKKIEVKNEYGKYAFVKDGTGFEIDGYSSLSYYPESFSSLVVAAGYTLTSDRVTSEATEEERAEYGLDKPIASWTLTDISDNEYTVHVGKKLVTGGGYYAMLEGRENCVYVLSTTLENSILKPLESYVSPLLCLGVTDSNYFTADNFIVMHGDEVFVCVEQCEKEEFTNPNASAETKLAYPAGYKTDDTFFLSEVIYKFVSMAGEEVVYIGDSAKQHKKYGLDMDAPHYSISFTMGSGENEVQYFFFVSELQEDGYYYAVSNLYDYELLIKCSPDTFGWLENKLIDWVDDYFISLNIGYVESISVDTADGLLNFDLIHGKDADGNATLEVKCDNGFSVSGEEVDNFRQLYKDFLSVQIIGEHGFTDEEVEAIMNDESAYMTTLTFNMSDGRVNKYEFYRYSTGRVLLSANGEENFFVYDNWILKILSDVDKLLNNLEIDSTAKG